MKKLLVCTFCGFLCLSFLAPLSFLRATELVWTPINPSFGGSPYNASWLMASAQAQNTLGDSSSGSGASLWNRDPIEEFEESLKRQLLSRLSRKIVDEAFGEDSLLPDGETEAKYTIGDYEIYVTTDGGISLTITDVLTGNTTTVEVPYY